MRYPPPFLPLNQYSVRAPINNMWQLFNIVAICLLLIVSLQYQCTIEAFSPSIRIQQQRSTVYHRSISSRYFSNNLNDEVDKDIDDVDKVTHGEKHNNDDKLLKRIRVISYRSTLFISAILLTTSALFDSNFLMGTGIDSSTFISIVYNYLPFAAGLSLLLAPISNRFIQVAVISLGLATCITGTKVLSILSLMSICIREIVYFGLAFKWEAFISLISLPLLIISDDYDLIATPMSALAISVLAVGKVLEPIEAILQTRRHH